MKKSFAAIMTTLALASSPAFAQAPAKVDPAATAAVQELLSTMRIRETMTASMQQMLTVMPQQLRSAAAASINNNPNLNADAKKQALDQVEKQLPVATTALREMVTDPSLISEMIVEMVPLYTRNFTVAEIRELTAFYRTPLGQKMMTTMPVVMAESMAISNRIMTPRINKMMGQFMQAPK